MQFPNLPAPIKEHARQHITEVLKRDGGRCVLCGAKGADIHHIEPRSRFGPKTQEFCWHRYNMAVMCLSCHSKAHGPWAEEASTRLKHYILRASALSGSLAEVRELRGKDYVARLCEWAENQGHNANRWGWVDATV